jgi:hypothetical protein
VLGFEVGISDLEREVPRVRAEEIQLFERRVTRGAGQAHRKCELIVRSGRTQQEADRARAIGEVPGGKVPFGVERHVVQAGAELERGVRPRYLFIEEQRRGTFLHGRRQRLFADGAEIAAQHPRADRARKPAARLVP